MKVCVAAIDMKEHLGKVEKEKLLGAEVGQAGQGLLWAVLVHPLLVSPAYLLFFCLCLSILLCTHSLHKCFVFVFSICILSFVVRPPSTQLNCFLYLYLHLSLVVHRGRSKYSMDYCRP